MFASRVVSKPLHDCRFAPRQAHLRDLLTKVNTNLRYFHTTNEVAGWKADVFNRSVVDSHARANVLCGDLEKQSSIVQADADKLFQTVGLTSRHDVGMSIDRLKGLNKKLEGVIEDGDKVCSE